MLGVLQDGREKRLSEHFAVCWVERVLGCEKGLRIGAEHWNGVYMSALCSAGGVVLRLEICGFDTSDEGE